jgi:alpha/beta superfamily hydrolase
VGIETLRVVLHTSDDLRLTADLRTVESPRAAAVLCHPHPLYGGDRTNPVVATLFDTLPDAGVTVLRFDFRGVGTSDGVHGDGRTEPLDVLAAVDALAMTLHEQETDDVPLWVVGYSFGAVMALTTIDPRIAGWVAIAPPLAAMPGEPVASGDDRPKHLVVPRHDQFTDPDRIAPIVERWTSTTVDVIESADHFLAGHLRRVADRVVELVAPLLS